MATSDPGSDKVVDTAFGAKNRLRLLETYFGTVAKEPVTASSAWKHVYRLLLWTDQTTGLAHCYESDKCQPGKRWYSRSLSFHDWLARELGVPPAHLADEIDWLFQRAAIELAGEVTRRADSLAAIAKKQREPFEGRGFPAPGADPELIAVFRQALGAHLAAEPSQAEWAHLIGRVRQYLALDNKRKNLLGEGFEDVLGQVLTRSTKAGEISVHVRQALHTLPGFNKQRVGDKENKVDVAIIRPQTRTLVTAKWSVRADREKQFTTDFADYVAAESDRKPFEYVFVTNEFDPARLVRACESLVGNAPMFSKVVHINTDALRATYGQAENRISKSLDDTMQQVLRHVEEGRLVSLEGWLRSLTERKARRAS